MIKDLCAVPKEGNCNSIKYFFRKQFGTHSPSKCRVASWNIIMGFVIIKQNGASESEL